MSKDPSTSVQAERIYGYAQIEYDVYWANALFTSADRLFNTSAVSQLRGHGFKVFLPQEAQVNHTREPSSSDVFRVDTGALLRSKVVVASLDQEGIDAGVACEVGVAHSWGIPVIGLYTDIRQYRTGEGRMYKNLYVLGAIESNGAIARSVEEVASLIPRYLANTSSPNISTLDTRLHFNSVSHEYEALVRRLETWYEPRWDSSSEISAHLAPDTRRVLEFGCGPGRLPAKLKLSFPRLDYLGYDVAWDMIRIAQQKNPTEFFTGDFDRVQSYAQENPFDIVIASFVLHDAPFPTEIIQSMSKLIRPSGSILLLDLGTTDLPRLTSALRVGLARPLGTPDTRMNSIVAMEWAASSGLKIFEFSQILLSVTFPSAEDLLQYIRVFGISSGMDLPLGLSSLYQDEHIQSAIEGIVRALAFPFLDQRSFVLCSMRK